MTDISLNLFPNVVGVRFMITPIQIGYDTLKGPGIVVSTVVFLIIKLDFFISLTIEEDFPDLFGKVLKWRVDIYMVMLTQRIEHLREIYGMTVCPWNDGSFPQ